MEYTPTSSASLSTAAPLSDATANTVVVTAEDSEVFTTGPLDAPGAMVEIVDTEPLTSSTPGGRKQTKKTTPVYREQLLLRYIPGASHFHFIMFTVYKRGRFLSCE